MTNANVWRKLTAVLLLPIIALSGCQGIDGTSDLKPTSSNGISATAEPAAASLTPAEKTRQEAEALLDELMKKNVTYQPLQDPAGQYRLKAVQNVHIVEMLTGEYSVNQTKSRYGIGGTDLGIPIDMGGETYLFFGDTFQHETMEGNWRSNVAAITTDRDYTDGIVFDRMITTGTGVAKELLRGKKSDNDEVTKIPTGGLSIDNALYLSFMSVKHWGEPGLWDCNYGAVAKSTDGGETWDVLPQLQWPGDSAFCQMAPVRIDDYIYVPGISGGRDGCARLMRVPVADYETFAAYEYLTGYLSDGTPVFETGTDAFSRADVLLEAPVGELSFLYSDYLGEWLVTYIRDLDIVVRCAKDIWGPYSEPVVIAAQTDFPGLYGAFMSPHLISEDGKRIGFFMSLWSPIYNVAVMEMELVCKP